MWLALTWLAGASFAALAWMYVGYALLVAFVARFWPRHHEVDPEFRPRVSLMIMTFNEEVVIDAKLENTLRLQYPWELLEVLVVEVQHDEPHAQHPLWLNTRTARTRRLDLGDYPDHAVGWLTEVQRLQQFAAVGMRIGAHAARAAGS